VALGTARRRRIATEVLREVETRAAAAGIAVHPVEAERLTQLAGTLEHQGLAGRMPEVRYDSIDVVGKQSNRPWLVLDRIHDPHNFGAVLRSCEVLGGCGVIVGCKQQAEVTPHVARSSAGAVLHVPLVRVNDLAGAIATLDRQIIVAVMDGDTTLDSIDFQQPSLVVLGNEGSGVADDLMELASVRASIPQAGRIESLNVGVAAGVILYEAQRQRKH
jgi:23S rRNA (guanosine2251-2'-O)-methyltransferase